MTSPVYQPSLWEYRSPLDGPAAYDTLKLSHSEWISIVEHIKMIGQKPNPAAARRKHARDEALGLLKIVIHVAQPGGSTTRLIARSHDLSPNGLGFIHGMYLHPNSSCICWLRHASLGLTPIGGTIRWCRHITGVVHMSGVQLDDTIKVSDYLTCPIMEDEAEE
ncbi:MAG: hypothetical protein ACIAXF_07295 [Phycisphaerales bacterium JB063]